MFDGIFGGERVVTEDMEGTNATICTATSLSWNASVAPEFASSARVR